MNSIYMIDDTEIALIDAGIQGGAAELVKEGLAELKRPLSELKHVFLTHGHHDTIGGAVEIKELAPHVKVHLPNPLMKYAEKIGVFLKTECFRLSKSSRLYFAVRSDPFQDLQLPSELEAVNDGDKFNLGKGTLFTIMMGGHSLGHTMYFYSRDRVMFSGDATAIIPASYNNYLIDYSGNMEDFQKALKFLEGARIEYLCPAHDASNRGSMAKEAVHGVKSAMEQLEYTIQVILSSVRTATASRLADEVYSSLGAQWPAPWHQLAPEPTIQAHLQNMVKKQLLIKSDDKEPYYKLANQDALL